jgi:hypothetical protein
MSFTKQFKIFVSHSGIDSDPSLTLQRELEREFRRHGHDVKVFNTSTVEDRFNSRGTGIDYAEKLRRYIERHIDDSSAYLLLVTPASLAARGRRGPIRIMNCPISIDQINNPP